MMGFEHQTSNLAIGYHFSSKNVISVIVMYSFTLPSCMYRRKEFPYILPAAGEW